MAAVCCQVSVLGEVPYLTRCEESYNWRKLVVGLVYFWREVADQRMLRTNQGRLDLMSWNDIWWVLLASLELDRNLWIQP